MIITDISATLDPPYPERIRSEADDLGLTRSGGLHLTPIIHSLEQAVRPREEWCDDEELAFYAAGGFLWERCYSRMHAEAIESGELFRPGEVERDGIIGSPDLIHIPTGNIVETKFCWKSVNKFDFQMERWFWRWLCQTKGYCYMTYTNVCEIHAFFCCGDWKPPIPCTRSIRIEYTDTELRNNWSMCIQHAREMGWMK